MHSKRPIFQPAAAAATFVLAAVAAGCTITSHPGEPDMVFDSAAVDGGVREFARQVAIDVTREGPAAWRRYFADAPSFFMVVNGNLAFPNSPAATLGIQEAAKAIPHIELQWGDGLRVDALTGKLAVVAAPYRELRVDTAGHRVDETGYFTGVAEYRRGDDGKSRWQFRDAHWSAIVPAPVP